jgi:hypothetical protein
MTMPTSAKRAKTRKKNIRDLIDLVGVFWMANCLQHAAASRHSGCR